MPNSSTRSSLHDTHSRRSGLRPLAVGIVVTIFAAVLNHFIFIRNEPQLRLGHYDPDRALYGHESADDPSWGPPGSAARLFTGLANAVRALDSRTSETMSTANQTSAADPADSPIAVVVIDEASLNRLGSWPWSRRELAKLMSHFGNAKVVGFDLLLNEADRTSVGLYLDSVAALCGVDVAKNLANVDSEEIDNDLHLGKVISSMETVLAVFFFNDHNLAGSDIPLVRNYAVSAALPDGSAVDLGLVAAREADDVMLSIDALRTSGRGPLGEGFMNLFPDSAGAVRSVPLFIRRNAGDDSENQGGLFPSLPLEMVRIGLGADGYRINLLGKTRVFSELASESDRGERHLVESVSLLDTKKGGAELLRIPVDEFGDLYVSARFHSRDYNAFPAWEVIDGRHDGAFDGKYVLFDVTAAGAGNVRASLLSPDSTPGVFVHANMISDMLTRSFLRHSFRTDYLWQQALVVVSGVLVTLGLIYGSYAGSLGICLAVLFFLTAGNYLIFYRRGLIVGMTVPMLSTAAVLVAQFIANHLVMGRERRFIRTAFSLSVSPSILTYLETHPDRMSSLAGEQRNMTVLFSDIRGFTAISENMTAPDLARFLNEYLTPMSDIVMQNMGTVDKFMGDAVMAFWNAPTDDPQHAKNAARSALAMLAKLDELQKGWTERGLPRLAIGCGINSGPIFAGYMGSEQRKNYTVMGDNVNIANRLESLNKLYSTNILISQSTREELGPKFFTCVVDKVRVSGRSEPVMIHELIGEGIQDEARYEEVASFERVFALYQDREFELAESLLKELMFIRQRPLYDMYLDRLAVYLALPPPADWDGVFAVSRR